MTERFKSPGFNADPADKGSKPNRFSARTNDWADIAVPAAQVLIPNHPDVGLNHNGKANGDRRNHDPSTQLENHGKLRGEASERAVLTILSNESLWKGLLFNVRLESATDADSSYFDISFELQPALAKPFRMTTIRVQVKSDPSKIEHYIADRIPKYIKNGRLQGGNHHPIVEQCLVFLNGGAGEVGLAGVVAPLFEQLRVLAELRGVVVSEEALLAVCAQANPDILKAYVVGVEKILDRDYGRAVALIELCEFDWQAGRIPAVERAGTASISISVAQAVLWNKMNGTHHAPGNNYSTQHDTQNQTSTVEASGKRVNNGKPAKGKQAKDTPERVKRRENHRRMS